MMATARPLWKRVALWAFVIGLVVVAVLLLLPARLLPETTIWDKLEHAGIFGGLAVVGSLAFPERGRSWWLALGLIAFGAVCEILQIFVPGRDATLEDAVANAVGVLSAVGLCRLLGPATARALGKVARRSGPAW